MSIQAKQWVQVTFGRIYEEGFSRRASLPMPTIALVKDAHVPWVGIINGGTWCSFSHRSFRHLIVGVEEQFIHRYEMSYFEPRIGFFCSASISLYGWRAFKTRSQGSLGEDQREEELVEEC